MTPGERKAFFFLAGLLVLGAGVRGVRAARAAPAVTEAERAALRGQIAAVDSAREASKAGKRRAGGLPRGTKVDLDRATAAEMEQVTGIGPVLAQRIVADRDSLGAFGGMEAVRGVRGVGPKLAERIAPQVTFSGPQRPQRVEVGRPTRGARARADPRVRISDSTTGRSSGRGNTRREPVVH
jgi:competence ComEA-like helix-hairpin-helix protein